MKNQVIKATLKSSAACLALCMAGSVFAQDAPGCAGDELAVTVTGKIFNNGQAGGSAFSTLGVVALKGDYPVGRMKCGIVGMPAAVTDPQLPLAFTHTISCDDALELPLPGNPIVHSQLAFDTQGYFHEDFAFCNGINADNGISSSFTEFSVPRAGEGRGVFTTATGGLLTIQGSISCVGTIDMNFSGEVCLAPPSF